MKRLALLVFVVACGSSSQNTPPTPAPAPPPDTRSPIEKRRDTACDSLGPKLTQCALADAKADLAAGKVTQKQFTDDTQPAVLSKNTEEFEKKCKVPMSSRQVRVLEVCQQQEQACEPLGDCLSHLNDNAGK
ncbi:MAG TPA: hypothetical protein VGM88_33800 [Kofleriaceae bacterium]|jgi:hypothetical protein